MTSAGIRKRPRRSDAEEVATAGKSELRMERAGHKSERAPISMMFLFVSFTMVKSFRQRQLAAATPRDREPRHPAQAGLEGRQLESAFRRRDPGGKGGPEVPQTGRLAPRPYSGRTRFHAGRGFASIAEAERRIIARRNACQIVFAGWVEQDEISRLQISEAT